MEPAGVDRELTTSRLIPAPRARVWAAMSDPRALAKWWGPDGFTSTVQLCELRPGGAWKLIMHAPNGASYPNENRFVELVPPERWVIEHASAPRYRLEVTLTERGGETEVHWRQVFAQAKDCDKLRAICVPANEQNLLRLAAAVGAQPQPR